MLEDHEEREQTSIVKKGDNDIQLKSMGWQQWGWLLQIVNYG